MEKTMQNLATWISENKTSFFMLVTLSVIAIVFSQDVIAATATSGVDSNMESIWTEISTMATGNVGKTLMMMTLIAVVVFSVVSPNLMGFVASAVSLVVLSNASEFIEDTLDASTSILQMLPL
ncbi:hypothetical protein LRP52_23885 [Photobacterium sp. ZSDE20]|uniref:Pili assembly chaperone n=1 Tax=Photobacterium pectinilyticum TaxID=2906793 RepID=A0ABT1N0Z4_9GAMM|nr:hypothetical protein [Photobacterium sp. ZSDE20]MCQ1058402.1 hypothetical protein [Photobacterium sp. ZSDE20]MDD1825235.1 hypothetical protein [Photobacterium sp. ZSDE20]